MSKKDNIRQTLYPQIKEKSRFCELVADEYGLSVLYVRCNYFSGVWAIPEKRQNRIIELLQNTIRNQ